MNRVFSLATLGVAVALLVSCGSQDDSILSIERETRVVPASQPTREELNGWEELEGGLVLAKIFLPRTFLNVYPNSHAVADPFADPDFDPGGFPKKESAQKILENAGIEFGPGTSASYSARTSLLTVVQTKEQMELVEAYTMGLGPGRERQMHVRAEIYRLPALAGIEVLESVRAQGDHAAERDAILDAVKKGKATLIASPVIVARSGQRAKTEQLFPVPVPEVPEDEEKEDGKEKTKNPTIQELPLLLLEVDPVLGTDEYTVDLNFQLELRHRDDPEFSHIMTTQVTMHDNDWYLVGTWNDVEFSEIVLVFFTVSLQTVGDTGEFVEEIQE
ncbi:MAG: hypothetical protein AAGF67_14450 [Verrucomicrobiota bacterium]